MKTTTKEVKQVKNILKNMQKYAETNNCSFHRIKYKKSELLNNQPQDLINYVLIENGFLLNFNVSFKEKIVYIEEFSEDDFNSPKEMTFKEFIKFQNYFLNNGLVTKNKENKRIAKIIKNIGFFKIKPIGYNINSKDTTLFYNGDDVNKILWKITQDLNDLFNINYVWRENCIIDLCNKNNSYNNLKNLNDDDIYLCIDIKLH